RHPGRAAQGVPRRGFSRRLSTGPTAATSKASAVRLPLRRAGSRARHQDDRPSAARVRRFLRGVECHMTTRRAPGAVESMSVLTKPRLRWWPFLLAAALPAACRADFRTEDDSAMGGRGGGAGSGASAGAPSWPECIEEETSCPGCETSADCAGGVCDPTTEQCVACLENADCAEVAAPRCESNVCKGCLDADDCAHFEDEALCDPESGACVACRGSEDCDGNVCHPHTKTCTDLPVRQKHACEPCQHDAECQEGQLCVETTYDDPSTGVVGAFCLWRRDAPLPGPQGTCGPNSRPYAR